MTARRVHAAVRAQLVATSPSYAPRSKPCSRRACAGTEQQAGVSHATPTSAARGHEVVAPRPRERQKRVGHARTHDVHARVVGAARAEPVAREAGAVPRRARRQRAPIDIAGARRRRRGPRAHTSAGLSLDHEAVGHHRRPRIGGARARAEEPEESDAREVSHARSDARGRDPVPRPQPPAGERIGAAACASSGRERQRWPRRSPRPARRIAPPHAYRG